MVVADTRLGLLWLVLLQAAPGLAQTGETDPSTETDPNPQPNAATGTGSVANPTNRPSEGTSPEFAAPVPIEAAATPDAAQSGIAGAIRVGWSWDLTVQAGLGSALEQGDVAGFGRLRAGVFGLREPLIGAVGVTAEVGNFGGPAFGLEAQALHLWSGVGVDVGAAYSLDDHWLLHASLSFSVVGLEWQHRFREGTGPRNALFVKIQIPIGVAAYLL